MVLGKHRRPRERTCKKPAYCARITLLTRSTMDEKYDAIVLGTGLKECIISGVLSSVAKLKVINTEIRSDCDR